MIILNELKQRFFIKFNNQQKIVYKIKKTIKQKLIHLKLITFISKMNSLIKSTIIFQKVVRKLFKLYFVILI